jgi:hypothetical protein
MSTLLFLNNKFNSVGGMTQRQFDHVVRQEKQVSFLSKFVTRKAENVLSTSVFFSPISAVLSNLKWYDRYPNNRKQ